MSSIEENTFKSCLALNEVYLKNSLNSIEYNAFDSCVKLEKITIPASVKTIDMYAFVYCDKLKEVCFEHNSSLKTLGNSSLKTLGNRAFQDCRNLKHFQIPQSVTKIGDRCFACDYGYLHSPLKQIVIPTSVKEIGEFCFYKCVFLEKVEFASPSSLVTIKNSAFYYCTSLKEISIPPSVTSIGSSCFSGCSNLRKVALPQPLIGNRSSYGINSSASISPS